MKKKGRIRPDNWFEKYRRIIYGLTEEKREFVELFRPAIREGIELATKGDNALECLDSYDEKKESLEYEELLFFIPLILEAFNTLFKGTAL